MAVLLVNGIRTACDALPEAELFWDRAAKVLAGAPGFLGARLLRSRDPEARYALMNVAEWASEQAYRDALMSPEFRSVLRHIPEGWESEAALYDPVTYVAAVVDEANLAALPDRWHFGGKGSGLEDPLAALVVQGIKTATSGWLAAYDHEREPLPAVRSRSVILDSEDRPVAAVELVEVALRPYLEVDETFARNEGEGDLSLEHWREAHDTFFRAYAAEIGIEWDPASAMLVCERFRVLEVFDAGRRWLP